MAAAEKHRKKGRESHRNSFFCFFGSCFGISNKVSADHGDGKSVKSLSGNFGRQGRTVLVNDQKITKIASSSEIVNLSKEIHIIEDEGKESQFLASSAEELRYDKTHDGTAPEKSKNKDERSPIKRVDKQNRIAQEKWTNPTRLSHSVSLPQAGGGEKGKKGREVRAAGEFDSMVGAVVVMVTLVVMLIWGKVCAILCTTAWFYFIPRFRANMDEYYAIKIKNDEKHVDLDSWEYKKKVVLEGLLDRKLHL